MTKIESIPVLLSPDIGATSAFGTSLGFEVERFADTYAILHGLGFEVHYAHTSRPDVCSEMSCYIRGSDVLNLHPKLRKRAPDSVSPIYHRDWGMTEFYLRDPHGNLWKFGLRTDDLPQSFTHSKET
jgi:uncharacterized glyoxalase superfamily protein PhnB